MWNTVAFSQSYSMQNGTETTCSGTFYDSGGAFSNYSNNESFTYTFCSNSGTPISFEFDFLRLRNGDVLEVYDGNGTTTLIASYTNIFTGANFTHTSTDASNCLTFVFTSNSSTIWPGWEAAISCPVAGPCQTVNGSITTSPTPNGAGEVRICQGASVDFTGAGSYPDNGTNYTQSDASSLFIWDFGDGTSTSGQGLTDVSHTFSDGQGYTVTLEIRDINGCENDVDIQQRVAVSTSPLFSGTTVSDDDLCIGESTSLSGTSSQPTFTQICSPPTADSLLLPDGVGVSYQTSTTLACYASGQTLTDAADINGICLNMEHTWANDLDVKITCPTGQEVILDTYAGVGGEVYLGVPIDGDDASPTPGTGFEYCWSPSPTYGTWNNEAANFSTLPAGSYTPDNALTGLVGCELNGDWTLTITDNLAIDNGFIFSFFIDLDIATSPPWTYTPSVSSTEWTGPASISNATGDPATATPSSAGTANYVYTVTDDFGCSYDTTLAVSVTAPPDPGTNGSVSLCSNGSSVNLFNQLGGSPDSGGSWSGPSTLGGGDQGSFNPGSMSAGVYTYTVSGTAPCSNESATVTVTLNTLPTSNAGPATATFCSADDYTAAATATNYSSLEWTTSGDGSFADDSIEDAVYTPGGGDISSGSVTLTLTAYGSGVCSDVSDNIILTILPDNDGDSVCDNVDLDDDNDGIPDSIEGTGDTDGDGVDDQFDLDSDNDGIYDLIEAGHGETDSNNDGILDGGPSAFGTTGILNTLETTANSGSLNYTVADSDTDGNIDSVELDSDNDGCNDVIEAGYLDGDNNGLLGTGN